MPLEELNQAEIINLLGSIYEHSSWVAEILFLQGITSQDNNVDFPVSYTHLTLPTSTHV